MRGALIRLTVSFGLLTATSPQYFPIVVEADRAQRMKACVFDNHQDPSAEVPYFFNSSVQLANRWNASGGRVETHFAQGGHCAIQSYADIVTCLDDGTQRLLPHGLTPPPPPSPTPPMPQPPATCITACQAACPNVEGKGQPCEQCLTAHKWDHNMVSACHGFPFQTLLKDFCGSLL